MKKITFNIIPFILLILVVSCNKDDGPAQQQLIPDEFIVIPETSFNSVSISWIVPLGENNQNLIYSIFLDNELIEDDNVLTTYTIDGLEIATNYTLNIVAKNENGETPIEVEFETLNPDNFTFFVESYKNEYDFIVTYTYNNEGQIIEAEDTTDNNFRIGEQAEYVYDQQGNLVNEWINGFNYGGGAEFTYENNELVHLSSRAIQQDGFFTEFDFISPDNYMVSTFDAATQNSVNYEVNLERSNGQVTSFQAINLDTQGISSHFTYVYEDGNVVGITNVLNDENWLFDYDDKYNFFNQKMYHRNPGIGMFFISTNMEVLYWNGLVPELMNHINKNNPVALYKNGQLLHTLTYEYTEFNYPSKIYVDDIEAPVELTYSYRPN